MAHEIPENLIIGSNESVQDTPVYHWKGYEKFLIEEKLKKKKKL